jgi:hypothetical protein
VIFTQHLLCHRFWLTSSKDHEFSTCTGELKQEGESEPSDILWRLSDYFDTEFPRLFRPQIDEALSTIIAERLHPDAVTTLAQGALQQVLDSFQRREGHMPPSLPDDLNISQTVVIGAGETSLNVVPQERPQQMPQEAFVNIMDDFSIPSRWIYDTGDPLLLPDDSGYGSLERNWSSDNGK